MKIAIYGQHYSEDINPYLKKLIEVLHEHGIVFLIEQDFYDDMIKSIPSVKCATFESHTDLDRSFDFMLTVGGDGTILRAVTYVRDSGIPIVGINTGRLGFLATVQKEEIAIAIRLLVNDEFIVKKRSLLQVTTEPFIENLSTLNFALNEVSVSRKNTTSMITVETYLDEEYLTSYWADGLIIATPTGSTGYSLSCGGPVITPAAKSFVLTPIAPHNLNARPLVIPDETKIKFHVSGRENEFFLSLDSRITTINSDTRVHVEKAPFNLNMVQIKKQTFLKTLREKLLWGQDTRN